MEDDDDDDAIEEYVIYVDDLIDTLLCFVQPCRKNCERIQL